MGTLKSSAGITIVEMLIASTILVVVLGSLGGLYVSSSRAYQTNRAVTASSGQLRSAVQALQYDVSLAGYCGVSADCELADPLSLEVQSVGDTRIVTSLVSAYVETRYSASAAPVTVRYTVAKGRLWRSQDGSDPVAIAAGVSSLELLGYLDRSASDPNQHVYRRPPPGQLSGLRLRLNYALNGAAAAESFSINLQNEL